MTTIRNYIDLLEEAFLVTLLGLIPRWYSLTRLLPFDNLDGIFQKRMKIPKQNKEKGNLLGVTKASEPVNAGFQIN
ncbi:hypothetical protein [Larkinella sp.]|uniref:hypothetical protein n=1 Tax=Larkinella sp. TaxID=2034517 RepID=UPI003BA995DC